MSEITELPLSEITTKCILLHCSVTTPIFPHPNQLRCESLLLSKQIEIEKLDGAMPENKVTRDILFGISSLRGQYPQVFLQTKDGTYTYIGNYEKIQKLIEVKKHVFSLFYSTYCVYILSLRPPIRMMTFPPSKPAYFPPCFLKYSNMLQRQARSRFIYLPSL